VSKWRDCDQQAPYWRRWAGDCAEGEEGKIQIASTGEQKLSLSDKRHGMSRDGSEKRYINQCLSKRRREFLRNKNAKMMRSSAIFGLGFYSSSWLRQGWN